jgi:large subunit ribosomal protein L30
MSEKSDEVKRLAAILVRGMLNTEQGVRLTFKMLNLSRKNSCAVVPNNENYNGMLRKVKDYITWGEIDDNTYNSLVEKKGEEYKGRGSDKKEKIKYSNFIKIGDKKIKKIFRLNPPKKGFGRKGIKVSFTNGGALGYRGDKINDLIKRML